MFLRVFTILLCALSSLRHFGHSSRILAIMPTASPSHGIWNRVLVKELARRGHQVTALIANPGEDTENLHYINIENSYERDKNDFSFADIAYYNVRENIVSTFEWMTAMCEKQLNSKAVKKMLNSKQKFDLVIFEAFGNDCFLGLLTYFDVPAVAVTAYGCYASACSNLGAYEPITIYPEPILPYTTEMTLLQRIENLFVVIYTNYLKYFYYLPKQREISQKVFGQNVPRFAEIEAKYYKVLLLNSGPAGVDFSKALPPSIIEVGCLQCRPGKPLPANLQVYLDDATNGAILFSLGSNIRSDSISTKALQIFLNVFSKLPNRIIWKWESDDLPGKSDNVMISKWLPQQDILAHSNLKLAIIHGGRLSVQEALYHGVPTLSIPFFMDQYINSRRAEDQGFGIKINFRDITEENLLTAIKHILADKKYYTKARKMSEIFKDQPETALNRAIFWTEYVIRHGNSSHLQSPVVHLPWYQLYLIDIAALIFCMVVFSCLILKSVIRVFLPAKCLDKQSKTKKS